MIRTTALLLTNAMLGLAAGCGGGAGEGDTTGPGQTSTAGAETGVTAAAGRDAQDADGAPDRADAEAEAPQVDHTPAPGVHGEEVTYRDGDTTMRGYLAYGEEQQGERPGVLVVHEWWGHNGYARKRADMLAKMGYTALAVDMYGGGKQTDHPDDAKKFSSQVMGDLEQAQARFAAAKEELEAHETTDPDETAAIGYCFGGGVVLHMARAGVDLDVVASFHGMLATDDPAEEGDIEAAKVLVYHGAADPFVPDEQVEAFREEMQQAGVDFEVVEYEGAKHGFTNPEASRLGEQFELPLAYDEEADQASWQHFSEQIGQVFGAD